LFSKKINSIIYIEIIKKEVITMKLKKVKKILPAWEIIRVWGNSENKPLYYGEVDKLPAYLGNLEMTTAHGDEIEGYFDIRYNNSDIEDHVAIFVEEE
jgi:hypothetical protein